MQFKIECQAKEIKTEKNTSANAKKFHVEHLRITLKPTLGYKVKKQEGIIQEIKGVLNNRWQNYNTRGDSINNRK